MIISLPQVSDYFLQLFSKIRVNPQGYSDLPVQLVNKNAAFYTLVYLITILLISRISPYLGSYRLLGNIIELGLQTIPTLMYLTQFNMRGIEALVYNLVPKGLRPYIPITAAY